MNAVELLRGEREFQFTSLAMLCHFHPSLTQVPTPVRDALAKALSFSSCTLIQADCIALPAFCRL